jgi:hypothetical protein
MSMSGPRLAALGFAVITLGLGVGFICGGIAFVAIGEQGRLFGSPFGHIGEVIGWGAGCMTSSLATFVILHSASKGEPGKPGAPRSNGLD